MTSTAMGTMSARDLHATARFNMVEGQLRTNKVSDPRLLAALSGLPRQLFVPAALASVAYVDKSLKIAPGRYLLEPLALARLLQEATIAPTDRALIIGAGTGYSTALVSSLAASVVALECAPELAAQAKTNLADLGIGNATIAQGPLEQGWAAGAPYDVILVDGMVADLPAALTAQLADYGRLVTIRAQDGRCGVGMLYRKLGSSVSHRILFDATSSYLPGFAPEPAFAL
jgi:protein-L-isoaspartate(D-aspartate) O-methyltransferase